MKKLLIGIAAIIMTISGFVYADSKAPKKTAKCCDGGSCCYQGSPCCNK